MSNGNREQDNGGDRPQFSVEKIYARDISFENPNSPHVFMVADANPKVDLDLRIGNRQIDDDHWEVSLKVSVLTQNSEDDSVIFEVEVEQAAVFLLKNIPEDQLDVLLGVECPSIIFPYVRQVVGQLSSDGGFLPLLLEPINFASIYQDGLAERPLTTN